MPDKSPVIALYLDRMRKRERERERTGKRERERERKKRNRETEKQEEKRRGEEIGKGKWNHGKMKEITNVE